MTLVRTCSCQKHSLNLGSLTITLTAVVGVISVMSNNLIHSLSAGGVILLQWILGFGVFSATTCSHRLGAIPLFGISIAIGSALFTTGDQILRATIGRPHPIIYWLAALGVFRLASSRLELKIRPEHEDAKLGAICLIAMFLGLGLSNPGALVSAFVVIVIVFCTSVLSPNRRIRLMIPSLGVTILVFYLAQRFFNINQPFWWALNRGSDDQIYSESLSWSVSDHGPFVNPLASGFELNYHWFSFAWSGMMSRLGGFEPFFTTLHIIGPISIFSVAALICAVIQELNLPRIALALTFAVSFAASSSLEPVRLFYVLNTSNLAGHIWLVLTIWILIRGFNSKRFISIVGVTAATSVTFLSKVPYGLCLLTGLGLLLVTSIVHRKEVGRYTTLFVGPVTCSLGIYIWFIAPPPWRAAGFRIGNPVIAALDGDKSFIVVFLILSTFLILHSWLIVPVLPSLKSLKTGPTFEVFLVGSASIGVLRFVLEGASSENYFLSAALVPISLLTAINGSGIVSAVGRAVRKVNFFLICALGFGITLSITLISKEIQSSTEIWKLVCISVVFVVVIAMIAGSFPRKKIHRSPMIIGFCLLLGTSQFIGSLFSLDNSRLSVNQTYVSTEQILGLNWLRQNSHEESIVATNLSLCAASTPCTIETARSIVSAFAHRTVYVEGPRSIVGAGQNSQGGRPFPVEIEQRIFNTLEASKEQSSKNISRLRCSNVTYLVVSPSVRSPLLELPKWAKVAYSNTEMTIISLEPIQSSQSCL